jgi:hypothetical protein
VSIEPPKRAGGPDSVPCLAGRGGIGSRASSGEAYEEQTNVNTQDHSAGAGVVRSPRYMAMAAPGTVDRAALILTSIGDGPLRARPGHRFAKLPRNCQAPLEQDPARPRHQSIQTTQHALGSELDVAGAGHSARPRPILATEPGRIRRR